MKINLKKQGDVFLVHCTPYAETKMELLAIVDSGSSHTYVSKKIRERANLKYKGESEKILCVHGSRHSDLRILYYRGTIALGTKTGNGRVYVIDAPLAANGLRVDAVLWRDVLRHFRVMLDWKDGEGYLEE